jgi:hypothetical protein
MSKITLEGVKHVAIASVGPVFRRGDKRSQRGHRHQPKDVCIPTGGGAFKTFVLKGVDVLVPAAVVALCGSYLATGAQLLASLHGSAVMESDVQICIGFFVRSSAQVPVRCASPVACWTASHVRDCVEQHDKGPAD